MSIFSSQRLLQAVCVALVASSTVDVCLSQIAKAKAETKLGGNLPQSEKTLLNKPGNSSGFGKEGASIRSEMSRFFKKGGGKTGARGESSMAFGIRVETRAVPKSIRARIRLREQQKAHNYGQVNEFNHPAHMSQQSSIGTKTQWKLPVVHGNPYLKLAAQQSTSPKGQLDLRAISAADRKVRDSVKTALGRFQNPPRQIASEGPPPSPARRRLGVGTIPPPPQGPKKFTNSQKSSKPVLDASHANQRQS